MNVSIVIPAFNAARTLAAAIDSVLAQVNPCWEAIVVDDGSTDGTGDLARAFAARDPRIRVVNQPNGGESAARNTGVRLAQYDWLLFLDADDWIAPNHLARLTAEIDAHPDLDAVHAGSVRVAQDGAQVADGYEPPAGDLFHTLTQRAAFPVHACIVRKSLVEAVGLFDVSLKKSADWDLWQRVARTGAQFGAVREVLAYYRMQPQSASLDAELLFRDGLRVLQRGHAADPRVPNPHPAHANGSPPEKAARQQFYLLSWCAGLLIGQGHDATSLLAVVPDAEARDLYPSAIAQCIFEAAPLPTCRTPAAWEAMWRDAHGHIQAFLAALEAQSKTPALAERALTALKRMVLLASPAWRPILDAADEREATQQAAIGGLEQRLDESRKRQAALDVELLQTRKRADALDTQVAAQRADLERAQQRTEALEAQVAAATADQERARHAASALEAQIADRTAELERALQRAEALSKQNVVLSASVNELRDSVRALEARHAELAAELERWREVVRERERLLEHLDAQLWIRVGRRLRAVT